MKKIIITSISILAALSTFTACGTAGLVASTAGALGGIAASTAEGLYGHTAGVLTNMNESKTHYAFELVGVTNDGNIGSAKTESKVADDESQILYSDNLVSLSFQYKESCFLVGLKSNSNKYLKIDWNDLSLDKTGKLKWKEADEGGKSPVTITKGAFETAHLYTYFDSRVKAYRTLESFKSQEAADKKGYAGTVFTLNIPVIRGDEVITYRVAVKITSVTVK